VYEALLSDHSRGDGAQAFVANELMNASPHPFRASLVRGG
jgi:hypothetical protein